MGFNTPSPSDESGPVCAIAQRLDRRDVDVGVISFGMKRHWNTYLAARQNQLRALKNIPKLVDLLWRAARYLVAADLGSRLFIGLLPVVGLWIGKMIVDFVVGAIRRPGGDS